MKTFCISILTVLLASQANAGPPSSYTIPQTLLPAVRDQGDRNACTVFAVVGMVETYYKSHSAHHEDNTLSTECLMDVRNWMFDTKSYSGADKPPSRPQDTGDEASTLMKTVQIYGIPRAGNYSAIADCRYNPESKQQVTLEQYQKALADPHNPTNSFGKGLQFELKKDPSATFIKSLLASNIVVGVAVVIYDDSMDNALWDYDPNRQNLSHFLGYHAVQLVGYTEDGHYIVKNSWGTKWGEGGYGKMSDKYMRQGWKETGQPFIAYISTP